MRATSFDGTVRQFEASTIEQVRSRNGCDLGWAQVYITPDRSVFLAGQFYARVVEEILETVMNTTLSIEGATAEGASPQNRKRIA